jgi:hypothetical protein
MRIFIRPLPGTVHQPVPDRTEAAISQMIRQILSVADMMFPIAALPDPTLGTAHVGVPPPTHGQGP